MPMLTMKLVIYLFVALCGRAAAAPTIVWQKGGGHATIHEAKDVDFGSLLDQLLPHEPSENSVPAVVFLVEKGKDGSEGLSKLSASGMLPTVADQSKTASSVFYHVSGLESAQTAALSANPRFNTAHLDLTDLSDRLMSKDDTQTTQPTGEILFVRFDPAAGNVAALDQAVSQAIESMNVKNVVLAGIRSADEVKQARFLLAKNRMDKMEKEGRRILAASRRRLEEEQGDNPDEDENNDSSGVYFVYMTPNILAGLLFGLLFITISYIGVFCMGSIQGQDVYVSKMPAVGREA